MKRAASLLIALCVVAFVVGLCGCGGGGDAKSGVVTAAAVTPQYYVTELLPDSGSVNPVALAIADASGGAVWVGGSQTAGGNNAAILWQVVPPTSSNPGQVTRRNLSTLGQVKSVNSMGRAAGCTADSHGFYWDGTTATALSDLGSVESEAHAIGGDAGTVRIAGYVYTTQGGAALWEFPAGGPPADPTIIGPVNGVVTTCAYGLWDLDPAKPLRIVGNTWSNGAQFAIQWVRQADGTLAPTTMGGGRPQAVNAQGDATGQEPGFLWKSGVWTTLPALKGYVTHRGHALNDATVVVGEALTAPQPRKPATGAAVRWRNGTVVNLNTLVSGVAGTLSIAWGINNQGMIAATSKDTTGNIHAYLLTPK